MEQSCHLQNFLYWILSYLLNTLTLFDGRYHMLLEAILKHSQRAGLVDEANALEQVTGILDIFTKAYLTKVSFRVFLKFSFSQAFHVMTVVPNQANDMMDIGRLQGFEVNKKSCCASRPSPLIGPIITTKITFHFFTDIFLFPFLKWLLIFLPPCQLRVATKGNEK